MADRVRNLQPGQRFRLKRTGDLYEFLGHKRAAERIERGLNINMNHADYYTVIEPPKDPS